MTHPDIPQDGLIYSWDEHGSPGSERVFAKIDVTGLSHGQIAGLRAEAKAMLVISFAVLLR